MRADWEWLLDQKAEKQNPKSLNLPWRDNLTMTNDFLMMNMKAVQRLDILHSFIVKR